MAWSNPFRKQDENMCRAWGYTFEITPQHLTKEDTAAMKLSYDTLGEAALNRLNSLYPLQKQARYDVLLPKDAAVEAGPPPSERRPPKRDLFTLLRDHALEDEILRQFWTEVNTVPYWVSWEQIGRGQEVFYRYGGPALTGLAFQSLLGGMVKW
ncbi:MAG: hypothetical protein LQ343_001604 [Gyalolechia ehrenbergii]|nr:MAG: hypothetical protein LQ343_001604 [Gyalolechia ehrenbergii]